MEEVLPEKNNEELLLLVKPGDVIDRVLLAGAVRGLIPSEE